MGEENYWSRAMRRRLSRRQALIGAGQVGLGIFGVTALGCTQSSSPTPTATTAAKTGTTPAAGATTAAAATKAPGTTPAAAQKKKGGTFRVAGGYAVQNVDPHLSTEWLAFDMWRLVSNGLLKQKPSDYSLQPDLAESWENPDPTTFIFKLRKGVKFQNKPPVNGREFTAEDVKYTIERISTNDPKFIRNSWFAQVQKIDMPDKYTVKFAMKAPYAPFMSNISALQTIIAPKECVDKYGDLRNVEGAIGTGPFLLGEGFRIDTGGLFKANPDYFDTGKPYVSEIRYDVIEDDSTRIAALRTGKHDIGAVTTASADSLKGIAGLVLTPTGEAFGCAGLGFNMSKKPFNDVKVRRAIHLAIDRQQILSTVCAGNGLMMGPLGASPIAGFTQAELAQLPGYRTDKTQDIAEAKKLLAEAGYPNGLEINVATTDKYSPYHSEPALIMQQNLQKIGVKMNLTMMEWGQFKAQEQAKGFDAEVTTLTAGTTSDPDSVLSTNYRTGGSRNYWNLSDPDLDKLIDAQVQELDPAKRKKMIRDTENKILELLPVAYQAYPAGFGGKYNYVKDLDWVPNVAASFRAYQWVDVWMDK